MRSRRGGRSGLGIIAAGLILLIPAHAQAGSSFAGLPSNAVAKALLDPAAQDEPSDQQPPASPPTPVPWRPPEPGTDGFDWIQLKSGEWLKGSLKSMQDYVVEFDSEEMDWQEFDWEDVYQIHSPHVLEVLLDGEPGTGSPFEGFALLPHLSDVFILSDKRMSVSGTLSVTRDKVTVQGREGPVVFDRSRLIAITRTGSHEIDHWSGKITMGLSNLTGNTDSRGWNTTVDLTRRTPATRVSVNYLGTMEELEGVESANNHRATVLFDYWLSRRTYLRVPAVEYFSDPFSNVTYRVSGVIGLGYDIVRRPHLEWDVSMGPGYQRTRFETVEAGEDQFEDTPVLAVGTSAEIDITKRVDLNLSYTGQIVSEQAGGLLHHAVTTLEVDVTKAFEVDLSMVWDHVSNPRTEADGTVPEKDDVRTSLSLGVNF